MSKISSNKADTTGKDLLIGIRPLIEAIQAGREIDKIFIQKGLRGENFQELWNLIKEGDFQVAHVPVQKLNRISRKNHQGVIAFTAAVTFQNLGNIIADTFEKGETPFFLILDRVTDVRNFGAICRTAHACGVHAVIIPMRGSAPVNEDALKTSAGALNYLPVCREPNLKKTMEFLADSGIKIVGCTEKGEDELYDVKMNLPLALVMGSEEDGISPEYQKRCHNLAKLPMFGEVGSLNVSVAAGAFMYEAIRQRRDLPLG